MLLSQLILSFITILRSFTIKPKMVLRNYSKRKRPCHNLSSKKRKRRMRNLSSLSSLLRDSQNDLRS